MNKEDILRIIGDSIVEENEDIEVIKTGSISLDIATDIGGIPKGRITTIYGPGGSGKTTVAMHVVKNAIMDGLKVLYIDRESTLDISYLSKIIGIDIRELDNSIFIIRPEKTNEVLDTIERVVKEDVFDLIILDSVGALISEEEESKSAGERSVATLARLLSPFLRKITPYIKLNNIAVVLINQVRSAIGSFFTEYTMPGGNVLNHQSSMIIEFYPSKKIKTNDGEITGMWVRAQVKKNKVGRPYRNVEFPIVFGNGIDYYLDLLNLAKKFNIIVRRGAMYAVYKNNKKNPYETLGRGLDKSLEVLYNNPDLVEYIENRLREIFITKGGK